MWIRKNKESYDFFLLTINENFSYAGLCQSLIEMCDDRKHALASKEASPKYRDLFFRSSCPALREHMRLGPLRLQDAGDLRERVERMTQMFAQRLGRLVVALLFEQRKNLQVLPAMFDVALAIAHRAV